MFFKQLGIVCLGMVSLAAAAPSDEANVVASRRGLLNKPESDISKRSSAGTIFVCPLIPNCNEACVDLSHQQFGGLPSPAQMAGDCVAKLRPRYRLSCQPFLDHVTDVTNNACMNCCRCSAFGALVCDSRSTSSQCSLTSLSNMEVICEAQNHCKCIRYFS